MNFKKIFFFKDFTLGICLTWRTLYPPLDHLFQASLQLCNITFGSHNMLITRLTINADFQSRQNQVIFTCTSVTPLRPYSMVTRRERSGSARNNNTVPPRSTRVKQTTSPCVSMNIDTNAHWSVFSYRSVLSARYALVIWPWKNVILFIIHQCYVYSFIVQRYRKPIGILQLNSIHEAKGSLTMDVNQIWSISIYPLPSPFKPVISFFITPSHPKVVDVNCELSLTI